MRRLRDNVGWAGLGFALAVVLDVGVRTVRHNAAAAAASTAPYGDAYEGEVSVEAARARQLAGGAAFVGDSRIEMLATSAVADRAENFGVSGDDLARLRYRLGRLDLSGADRIVLSAGFNDWHTTRLQGFGPRYAAVLQALPAKPLVAVAIIPANPRLTAERQVNRRDFGGSSPRIRAANAAIAELCAARSDCRFLPVPPAMLDAAGELRSDLTTDGVHLNAAGSRVWAAALRAALTD